MMLEQLDRIDWPRLTHAYGPATDVPQQIRNLASEDDTTREQALWSLYGNIFHQGTRYQATPYAVPFLYELISQPKVQGRDRIVRLLVSIALGYEEGYLPQGVNVSEFRRIREQEELVMNEEFLQECEEYGFGPRVELECYEAVEDGAPSFLKLLTEVDPQLRQAAVYALAWFPDDAFATIPAIEQFLATAEDELDLAHALLTLGLLQRTSRMETDTALLRDHLSHPSLGVRVCAAIALAREPISRELLDVLIEGLGDPELQERTAHALHFNEGHLKGYISLVLAQGTSTRERIVPALCEALKFVKPMQSLDITRALLTLLSDQGNRNFEELSASQLDPLELTALRAIADHGGWNFDDEFGGIFINYCQLVRAFGLPDSREKLRKYLGQ